MATRIGGTEGQVTAGTTVTLTLPTWAAGTRGVIVVFTNRSSSGNTCTTPSGYTQRATWIDNSSDNNYVFTKAMTDADSGASVSLVWSGANNSTAVAEVWSGVTLDTIGTQQAAGTGTVETAPAANATGGSSGAVLAFGGGRGNADGTTVTISSYPSGYSNGHAATSIGTSPASNAHGWAASSLFSNPVIGAAATTVSGTVNSRGAIQIVLADFEPVPTSRRRLSIPLPWRRNRRATIVTPAGAAVVTTRALPPQGGRREAPPVGWLRRQKRTFVPVPAAVVTTRALPPQGGRHQSVPVGWLRRQKRTFVPVPVAAVVTTQALPPQGGRHQAPPIVAARRRQRRTFVPITLVTSPPPQPRARRRLVVLRKRVGTVTFPWVGVAPSPVIPTGGATNGAGNPRATTGAGPARSTSATGPAPATSSAAPSRATSSTTPPRATGG